jgi:pimeloyl-ACP methyl ester carboxylesterase
MHRDRAHRLLGSLRSVFAHEVGAGSPLVPLHGIGLHHRRLLPLESTFEDSGRWRRIYLDLPGAIRSPATGARSLQAVVEEIRSRLGDEPFAVLRSSFGGMNARYTFTQTTSPTSFAPRSLDWRPRPASSSPRPRRDRAAPHGAETRALGRAATALDE